MTARRAGRTTSRGQALVEFGVASVFLIVLLAGAAQVGVIYYDYMSVDTAAREAARVAAANPGGSTVFSSPNSPAAPGSYTCTGSSDANVVCAAAYKSTYKSPDGLVDPSQMTVSLKGSVYAGSSPTACAAGNPSDGVVAVTVSYKTPIFVPFLNKILASSGAGYRSISTTLSVRVEPCDVTGGN